MLDEHWDYAPGTDRKPRTDRKGRRGESEARVEGLEARIEQWEEVVEGLKALVKHQGAVLKEVAAKVAMWSWLETDANNQSLGPARWDQLEVKGNTVGNDDGAVRPVSRQTRLQEAGA